MTSTHTDEEIQAQWDRAARALEKRLRPYMQDLIRADFARQFIRDMATQGFRPPLRPPRPQQTAAPPSGTRLPAEYLAAKAATLGHADQEGTC